ncbi:MAG: SDR family NAD(P)-dependent oxidoreductase [Acidobacteriota bacterium]
MDIAARSVLVTGASSGIGAATAVAMARAGAASVALAARSEEGLERVAEQVRALGASAGVFPADLADPAAAEATGRAVVERHGAPDVLVNNAGAGRWLFTEDTPAIEAAAMMAVPYLAAFAVTRAVLPAMLARRHGAIVTVTSPAAFCPWPGATAYAAARWAMRGFHEALRADLTGTGLHVALVVPGEVRSPYFEHNPGSHERIPRVARLYRVLEADEAAALVVRAVKRERRVVVAPALLRMTLGLHRYLPGPVEWLVRRTGANRVGRHAV